MVRNDFFEICAAFARDGELEENGLDFEGDCKHCPYHNLCNRGEEITCDNCDGKGEMIVDLRLWEVVE